MKSAETRIELFCVQCDRKVAHMRRSPNPRGADEQRREGVLPGVQEAVGPRLQLLVQLRDATGRDVGRRPRRAVAAVLAQV